MLVPGMAAGVSPEGVAPAKTPLFRRGLPGGIAAVGCVVLGVVVVGAVGVGVGAVGTAGTLAVIVGAGVPMGGGVAVPGAGGVGVACACSGAGGAGAAAPAPNCQVHDALPVEPGCGVNAFDGGIAIVLDPLTLLVETSRGWNRYS